MSIVVQRANGFQLGKAIWCRDALCNGCERSVTQAAHGFMTGCGPVEEQPGCQAKRITSFSGLANARCPSRQKVVEWSCRVTLS